MTCNVQKGRALRTTDRRHVCFAKSSSRFHERLQHSLRSKVERLMTLSTSAVAVCCCSDCRNSLSSRVFSMAMTAWAAKFCY